ncbi:MAG: trypsin-like peptidase domain-containing protein [Planctomycetaceae bacterium]
MRSADGDDVRPTPSSFESVNDAVQPKVVKIFGAGGLANLAAYGSGFLISPDGHIVTVWSHLLDGPQVTVVLSDGRRFFGHVVGAEPDYDLALLKIDAQNLPYFDISAAAEVGPGTRVLAFSNVFKVATGDEPVTVMQGIVAARTNLTARRGRFEVPYRGPAYILDAVTNSSGAAGGVLTTADGQLLGMIGRELRNAESNLWINYSIPISELTEPINALREGREIETNRPAAENAATGYTALDFGLMLVPDVVYRTPAYVDQILPGSVLDGQDLRPDDLVVFVNNELVPSIRALEEQLSRLQAEDDLVLVVRRGNQLISVAVTVPRKEQR